MLPAYEYLYVECENENTFSEMIHYLEEKMSQKHWLINCLV